MVVKRRIDLEITIVMALSLGKAAVYSILAFASELTASAGLSGSSTTINQSEDPRPWLDFSYQLVGNLFQLVPVALAFYLLGSNVLERLGLVREGLARQLLHGLILAAAIGIPGLGLYLGARALGLSANVIPTDVIPYWWTIPMLLLSALVAGLVEEGLMIGYLFTKLRERGTADHKIILISALIRGTYHLYQGFGGFVGNVAMGLVFGELFRRKGRLIPLVTAHFLLDAAVFVGYSWAAPLLGLH